jgi:hypothetical protein
LSTDDATLFFALLAVAAMAALGGSVSVYHVLVERFPNTSRHLNPRAAPIGTRLDRLRRLRVP